MLNEQRRFLTASCARYDEGEKAEALRLANHVYIVVQDGGRQKSLLNQAGIRKATLEFETMAPPVNPNNLLRDLPLVGVRITFGGGRKKAQYLPKFALGLPSEETRRIRFHDWWEAEDIYREPHGDKKPFTINRRQLVLNLRNQEGGAHFDAEPDDDDYERFSGLGPTVPRLVWVRDGQRNEIPVLSVELAAMRQIAWELMQVLDGLGIGDSDV